MIIYLYTDIDNLEKILSVSPQGQPILRIEAKHRSLLSDDPHSIFGRYILPSCIADIENDLGVMQEDSIGPLLGISPLMEAMLESIKCFNDRDVGIAQFVTSFYEDIDQFDLWMRYAEKGNGVSIGLDTDLLQKPFGQVFNFNLQKCNYWQKDIKECGFHLDNSSQLYRDIKETYKSMSDSRVIESFRKIYSQEAPDAIVNQRIKENLLYGLITTFDLFQKTEEWSNEKEHRITVCTAGNEIHFKKGNNADYIPYTYVDFPIGALKIIMIGPKCGRNAYGMIQSMLCERRIRQAVQVLDSGCSL